MQPSFPNFRHISFPFQKNIIVNTLVGIVGSIVVTLFHVFSSFGQTARGLSLGNKGSMKNC